MDDAERRALTWPGLALPERVAFAWLARHCGTRGAPVSLQQLREATGLADRPARAAVEALRRLGLVLHLTDTDDGMLLATVMGEGGDDWVPAKGIPEARAANVMPHTCPRDFAPTARTTEVIAKRWPTLDQSYEALRFTLYWSQERPNIHRTDWQRSFMNWCARAGDSPPTRAPSVPFGDGASSPGRPRTGGEWLDDALSQAREQTIEGDWNEHRPDEP